MIQPAKVSRYTIKLGNLNSIPGGSMMNIFLLGIDIAKNIFQLHGVNQAGNAILKKRNNRNKLPDYVANLTPCTIVMESCGGANLIRARLAHGG